MFHFATCHVKCQNSDFVLCTSTSTMEKACEKVVVESL